VDRGPLLGCRHLRQTLSSICYDSNNWVAKLCVFLFRGLPSIKRCEPLSKSPKYPRCAMSQKKVWATMPGVNFANILQAAFSIESVFAQL